MNAFPSWLYKPSETNQVMKKSFFLSLSILLFSGSAFSQTPALVDYDAFEKLVSEVKPHRAERLVTVEEFVELSKRDNVVILDTRSDQMYRMRHVKGAIHLDFTEFTQATLVNLIPDQNTTILIYCNNNFSDDEEYFPSKMARQPFVKPEEEITLALNIPTYINLYGYGYRNVYELKELISIFDQRIQLEGDAVLMIGE